MAFRRILKCPNLLLRKKSEPVTEFNDETCRLVQDLYDTLNVGGGAGLSAPQIGELKRVIYLFTPENKMPMINPVIVESKCKKPQGEGCLSFPGVWETVSRYDEVKVNYLNTSGEMFENVFHGLDAQVIQLEIEHLDGKLIVDHFSRIKRERIGKKVNKVKAKVKSTLVQMEEREPRRVKKNKHLSQKELKLRRLRKKKNRSRK